MERAPVRAAGGPVDDLLARLETRPIEPVAWRFLHDDAHAMNVM